MTAYTAYFRMSLISRLQYRAAAWSGIVTQLFWGFMQLMVYKAFYDSSDAAVQPLAWSQVVCYIWIRQAFFILVNESFMADEITKKITDGGISYELCRPVDLYFFWYIRLASGRVAATSLRFIPVLAVAFLVPGTLRLALPVSAAAGILFLLTILLGMLLLNCFLMFVYIAGMRTLSLRGPRSLVMFICAIFMGSEIPLPFFPDKWQFILSCLPFRYIQDLPLRVYSGNIPVSEALPLIVLQLAWIAVLICAGKLWMRRQTRHIVAQGG